METKTPTAMAKIKSDLIEALEHEKSRLIAAIVNQLADDPSQIVKPYGAVGRIPGLPGMLYINCDKEGNPCHSTGSGRFRISHYYWIPATYQDGGFDRSYTLSLVCEDLDIGTGNIHADFTRLQMARAFYNRTLAGGLVNPGPISIERGWRLDYLSEEFFPCAARKTSGRTVTKDEKPWGYTGFEKSIPILDMADPSYDPEAVAEFFIKLITHDIREELRASEASQ